MAKSCPMAHPECKVDCAWYMDGKCAVVVIAEKLLLPKPQKSSSKQRNPGGQFTK